MLLLLLSSRSGIGSVYLHLGSVYLGTNKVFWFPFFSLFFICVGIVGSFMGLTHLLNKLYGV
jgi:hypothetical protein